MPLLLVVLLYRQFLDVDTVGVLVLTAVDEDAYRIAVVVAVVEDGIVLVGEVGCVRHDVLECPLPIGKHAVDERTIVRFGFLSCVESTEFLSWFALVYR